MCLSHEMASMYCWPSVSIKRGARLIVGRKVIKAEFEWTFGYLLSYTVTIKCVCIKWFLKIFILPTTDSMFGYFLPKKHKI